MGRIDEEEMKERTDPLNDVWIGREEEPRWSWREKEGDCGVLWEGRERANNKKKRRNEGKKKEGVNALRGRSITRQEEEHQQTDKDGGRQERERKEEWREERANILRTWSRGGEKTCRRRDTKGRRGEMEEMKRVNGRSRQAERRVDRE
jgi:hypothetical protein